jgi:penicillin-binding protein 1A
MAANASAKPAEISTAPPVLSKRGADILVRVERLLDDAAKKVAATPPPASSSALPIPRGTVAAAN